MQALILVNTGATHQSNGKDLPWKNAAQNGQAAENLIKQLWKFQNVKIVKDGSKADIIAAFDLCQREVEHFNKNKKTKETMLTTVFWIGHTWYGSGHHAKFKVKPPDGEPGRCADKTVCPRTYGVTKTGELIALYEYMSRLCEPDNCHAVFVLDWFSLHLGQLTADYIKKDDPCWELKLDNHRGWIRFSSINTGVGELCLYFRE